MNLFKNIQRMIYDILTNKYQIALIVIVLVILLFLSHLGEFLSNEVLENNDIKLCNNQIDVVYTWVNGSDFKFKASINKYLNRGVQKVNDYSEERYDDKYELKYSLRSLEKYAPWINHVYIVTNGQIPYWLNLDYEKVSIISHKDIFENPDNLPTFSSPAIESNIHRIPGLSKQFIYFNDDIFLGAPVYPDDFFSLNKGFLIYLAWPLPSCVSNCPWIYVGDGQCDSSCYNVHCQFDGGDCDSSEKRLNSHNFNSHHDIENDDLNNDYYDYYDEEDKIHEFVKRQILKHNKNNNSNKSLTDNVQIIKNNTSHVSMTTGLKTNKLMLNNSKTNVVDVVNEHNKKFITNDKMKRKKKLFKSLRKRKSYYKNVFNNTNINNSTEKDNNNNLDTYALSLQHTHRIFNLIYGYKMRKVPAHAPILIDKNIMTEFQNKFKQNIIETQKNRFRSANDIQFSFSYYYYVMNEKIRVNMSDIFDMFDTDSSGTWSDREIRTILTKINDLPLNYGMVETFDNAVINCSKHLKLSEVTVPPYERYIDSKLPTVSKNLVLNCHTIINMLESQFGVKNKYFFDVIKNSQGSHVMFKMLTSNISDVVGHLDEIRKTPRKFVCLNDNMDSKKTEENDLVKAILLDFYISLFPKPSKFELPQEFRNRFKYLQELQDWKDYHLKLKIFLIFCITVLICFCFYNICKRRCVRQLKNIIYL